MSALIIAFDGVLADTLPLRAHALADACAAELRPRRHDEVLTVIAGRTMLEAALALFPADGAGDPVLPELVALRAQRGYRHLVQHGVSLRADVIARIRSTSAQGTRLVLRADSERRDVEPLLHMAGLEHQVTVLRCSDDLPRSRDASIVRSWRAIDSRLASMQQSVAERHAWEASPESADAARAFVATVQLWPAAPHTHEADREHHRAD